MNIYLNDKILLDIVYKCLCRVLKNKKIYHRFKCFIGYKEYSYTLYSSLKCMQHYIYEAQCADNPFYYTSCKEDIFNKLIGILGNDNKITKENINKVQMRVMQCLNTLLHACVERIVGSLSEVEAIGQETFEMACKRIYGDDFVDVTEKNIPENIKQMIKFQKEFLSKCGGVANSNELYKDPLFLDSLMKRGLIKKPRHLYNLSETQRGVRFGSNAYKIDLPDWTYNDADEIISFEQ